MRKILWCCVAAGAAAVCCAFWAAAYVSQNPDSTLGRCALAVCPVGPHAGAAPGQPGATETDDLVPEDPVPVDDPPPPLPTPGSHVPPEVMALGTPPIIIQDEEDLNALPNPARTEPSTAAHSDAEAFRPSTVDIGALARKIDDDSEPKQPAGPPVMPYCAEDDGPAPRMPYCTDDNSATDGREDVRNVSAAPYHEFDACAFWVGFFSGPSHVLGDAARDRCEEDVHYPQQYSGAPYTAQPSAPSVPQPATEPKLLPALPESGELSAPKPETHADPSELFSHPSHAQTPRPIEPQSDTMEMRPSDWKPYSLDPGPF